MYWGDLYGSQWDIGYKFYENNRKYQAISLNVGTYQLPKNNTIFNTGSEGANWDYLGCSYLLSLNGFYLQTGITLGKGTYENPNLIIATGYNFRF